MPLHDHPEFHQWTKVLSKHNILILWTEECLQWHKDNVHFYGKTKFSEVEINLNLKDLLTLANEWKITTDFLVAAESIKRDVIVEFGRFEVSLKNRFCSLDATLLTNLNLFSTFITRFQ